MWFKFRITQVLNSLFNELGLKAVDTIIDVERGAVADPYLIIGNDFSPIDVFCKAL